MPDALTDGIDEEGAGDEAESVTDEDEGDDSVADAVVSGLLLVSTPGSDVAERRRKGTYSSMAGIKAPGAESLMPLLRLIRHMAKSRQRFMYGFMMLCIASALSLLALPSFKESALGVPGRLCSSSSGPELKLAFVVVSGWGPDVEATLVRDAEVDLLDFRVRVRGWSSMAEASCGAPGYFRCTAFPGAEGSSRGCDGPLSTAIKP